MEGLRIKLRKNRNNIQSFAIMLVLAVLTCGIFIKFHMITDTYWNIGEGYEKYKLNPLKDGRIVNYLMISFVESINLNFETYQIITSIINIFLYTISAFILYNYLLKKLKIKENRINKLIALIASFTTFFNPVTVESFAYTEIVIALSTLFCTIAAIIFDKNGKYAFTRAVILVIIASLTYQGTINWFITLSVLLFALEIKHRTKEWGKKLLMIFIITLISLVTMVFTIYLANNIIGKTQVRLGINSQSIWIRILDIIVNTFYAITIYTYGLFQKYLILLYIIITFVLILLISNTKARSLAKYLFIILVALFSCILPIYLQKMPLISARMSMSIEGYWACQ